MKKLIVLLTVFVMAFAIVSPALADEPRSITLIGVEHVNKGLVFKFNVTGAWEPGELEGYLQVGSHIFPLDCQFNDDGVTLVCISSYGSGGFAGSQGILVLAGEGFYFGIIPAKQEPGYCFDIWALYLDLVQFAADEGITEEELLELLYEDDPIYDGWLEYALEEGYMTPAVVGGHCSYSMPEEMDMIAFDHPQPIMTDLFYYVVYELISEEMAEEMYEEFDGKLPAIFVPDDTGDEDVEYCLPNPAYHAFGSLLYHYYFCVL